MSESDGSPSAGELGERLRLVRDEIYGSDGVAELARSLGVPPRTWSNYEEIGELAPAQVLLRFIELTGVDPLWLLRGEGHRYRRGSDRSAEQDGTDDSIKPMSPVE